MPLCLRTVLMIALIISGSGSLLDASLRQSLVTDSRLDDVVFGTNVLFERMSVSVSHCALRCSGDDDCMAFSYVEVSSGIGPCRGYTVVVTNATLGTKAAAGAKTFNMDPCARHTVLDEPWRDVNNGPGGGTNHCDKNLAKTEGRWYRLMLNGTNAVLPTYCVPRYHCGTENPIWLNLQGGSLPDRLGQEKPFRSCRHHDKNKCCKWPRQLMVRHCGTFFIYQFEPRLNCPSARCAQRSNSP